MFIFFIFISNQINISFSCVFCFCPGDVNDDGNTEGEGDGPQNGRPNRNQNQRRGPRKFTRGPPRKPRNSEGGEGGPIDGSDGNENGQKGGRPRKRFNRKPRTSGSNQVCSIKLTGEQILLK